MSALFVQFCMRRGRKGVAGWLGSVQGGCLCSRVLYLWMISACAVRTVYACTHARARAHTHTHTQRRQAGNPAHGEALVAGFSQRQKSPQVVMSWSKLRRLKTSRQDWHSFHCVAICTPCNAVCTEPTSPDAGRCYVTKTCPCVLLSMTVRQRSQGVVM